MTSAGTDVCISYRQLLLSFLHGTNWICVLWFPGQLSSLEMGLTQDCTTWKYNSCFDNACPAPKFFTLTTVKSQGAGRVESNDGQESKNDSGDDVRDQKKKRKYSAKKTRNSESLCRSAGWSERKLKWRKKIRQGINNLNLLANGWSDETGASFQATSQNQSMLRYVAYWKLVSWILAW